MHVFSHLLFRTHSKLNSLSLSGVDNLELAITHTETEISSLKLSDSDPYNYHILMEHYAMLSALQQQHSIKWAQHARLHWIKDGDRNTKFFYSVTRITY